MTLQTWTLFSVKQRGVSLRVLWLNLLDWQHFDCRRPSGWKRISTLEVPELVDCGA